MDRQNLIRRLTADVLKTVDPDEALLVASYTPDQRQGAAARGPLGSGLEVGITLLLPVLYRFFDKFLEQAAKRVGDVIVDAILKWMGKTDDAQSRLAAHTVVVEELVASGVEPSRALIVADAILETLKRQSKSIKR